MPDRVYQARRKSPAALDHFFAHDTISIISFQWIAVGIVALVVSLISTPITESAISIFPSEPLFVAGIAYILGGALVLCSIYTRFRRIDIVWLAKKIGYTFVLIGAGIYTFYVVTIVPLETFAILFGVGHILIGIAGLCSVEMTERNTREIMREQGYDA